ncbi:MAG TPA: GRP family sugar transporter [Terracidiphilus sp.]|nr:GRP family sugar transporter [Terracidiphilus sp.]
MFLPETYQVTLALMILSMLCWGSWANTLKLCPGFRFQLFYWDYAIGLLGGAAVLGLTAGSLGHSGQAFLTAIAHSSLTIILWAFFGGVIFNVANLLLVAAIDVAGLAVAFPVGIGLALVVGAVSSYLVSPAANPVLLFGGVALVTLAIILDAMAYRKRESSAESTRARTDRPVGSNTTTRGIVLSLVAGVLMGSFYPLVAHAMRGPDSPGPYAIAFFFAIGVLISTIPANLLLMARPLDGKPPADGADYWRASMGWHAAGILGGAIWCVGAVANFVASGAHLVGPAVSYSIGQGATMVSALWGVFVWREFAGAPRAARMLLVLMFVFFLLGLTAVALAPLHWRPA